MCYDSHMNITDHTIAELVKMLLRGIQSPVSVDPIAAANRFQKKVEAVGADYPHYDGCGWLYLNDDDVMLVHWTGDGVEFDEHSEHPLTLDFIKLALEVLEELERLDSDDEDSDDLEWI